MGRGVLVDAGFNERSRAAATGTPLLLDRVGDTRQLSMLPQSALTGVRKTLDPSPVFRFHPSIDLTSESRPGLPMLVRRSSAHA